MSIIISLYKLIVFLFMTKGGEEGILIVSIDK